MTSETDGAQVRLAELVAALSLGIDLGFGQPMEHVLRQCLIALRLAERIGLDEEERAVVYYTALLVNVGCHSDAHEQAKWFGDDIALKSVKYDYELGSARATAAAMRRIGSGNPPLHRFRVGLEFALSGRKDVDDMIVHHTAIARSLGEQLGLPDAVLEALSAAYEQWDGHGWPGELKGEDVPLAARLAQLGGVRRGRAPGRGSRCREGARPQARPASSSIPELARAHVRGGGDAPRRPRLGRDLGRGDRRRAGARRHALGRALRRRAPGDRELRRPEVAVQPRPRAAPSPTSRPRRARSSASPADMVRTLRRAGLVHDFGRLGHLELDLGQGRAARRGRAGARAACTRT